MADRTLVLVIEDDLDARSALVDLLSVFGYEVVSTSDPAEGLEHVRRGGVDLVICDIDLPGGLDGYGFARSVRGDPATADVKLVALTGYVAPRDRHRAEGAGFDAHLGKPVDPAAIPSVIAELLG